MTGALIFRYSSALEIMTSSVLPVMPRMAAPPSRKVNAITNTHHTK